MNISPLAVVHPEAQIGQNVTIDPFAVIEKDVVIGDNCHIYSHAVILDGARIGKNCNIFPALRPDGSRRQQDEQDECVSFHGGR